MINIAVFISGRGSNFKSINEAIKSGLIKNARISIVISDNSEAYGLTYARQHEIPYEIINHPDKNVRDNNILNTLHKKK